MNPADDPALARLVERVQDAYAKRTALDIRGGDSKSFYGEARTGEPLDTRELRGISSYEPSELVVTARAGTPLAELESILAERNQRLAFEPPHFAVHDASTATVGGMVAAGLSGPARARAGSVRDFVLGATLLNGRGEVLTFGGQVMKNVAGYDVARLLAGSLGILGVICEVSLKVMPNAAETSTLRFEFGERDAIVQVNAWIAQALPIDASAWRDGQLWIRLNGAHAAVDSAKNKLGGEIVHAAHAAKFWTDMRDHRDPFFAQAREATLWRLSVPSTTEPLQLPGTQLIEWHGAQRWWRSNDSPVEARKLATKLGGHATLFYARDRSVGVFTPLQPPLDRIHRELKKAFDPAGIFNRGRMFPEL